MVAVIDMALSSLPKEKRKEIARSMRMHGFEQRGSKQCAHCAEIGTLCWKLPNRSHCDKCFVDGVVCRPMSTASQHVTQPEASQVDMKKDMCAGEVVDVKPSIIASPIEDPSSLPQHPVNSEADKRDATSTIAPKSPVTKREDLIRRNFSDRRNSGHLHNGPSRARSVPYTPESTGSRPRSKMYSDRLTSFSASVVPRGTRNPRLPPRRRSDDNERTFGASNSAGGQSRYRAEGRPKDSNRSSSNLNRSKSGAQSAHDTPCQKNKRTNNSRSLPLARGNECKPDSLVSQSDLANVSVSADAKSTPLEMITAKCRTYKDKCKRLRQKLKASKRRSVAQVPADSEGVSNELEELRDRNRMLNERVIVAEIAQNLYKSMARGGSVTSSPCKAER